MEFRILGPLEVVGEHGPVTLHRGKEQALLTFMLLHANELLPSERLIDELWDGRPPATAPKILQNAVSQLRKALGNGRLETRPPGYVFHLQPEELDLHRFERLAREGSPAAALALWRGAPLVDLREERFADDARRRLEGRLMRALYGAGRQGDALEAYRRARRTLSEELGLEPGPQLQELERKILNQDPELAIQRLGSDPVRGQTPGRRPRRAVFAAGLLVLAAAVVGIVYAVSGTGAPLLATQNSLGVVDAQSNRVVGVIPIGGTPRGVTVGAHAVWAANAGGGTVSEIDPKTLRVVQTIGLGKAATALVEAFGELWVATGSDDTVVRIDPRSGGVLGTIGLPNDATASAYAIAAGAHDIWVGSGNDIVRINPSTRDAAGRLNYGGGINDIAVSGSSLWIVSSAETVARFSASALRQTGEAGLGVIPSALAIGGGSVWVAASAPYGPNAAVWRVDPVAARVIQTTSIAKAVGYPPTLDVAYGAGALWVASYDAGTVIRINPRSGDIVKTIR